MTTHTYIQTDRQTDRQTHVRTVRLSSPFYQTYCSLGCSKLPVGLSAKRLMWIVMAELSHNQRHQRADRQTNRQTVRQTESRTICVIRYRSCKVLQHRKNHSEELHGRTHEPSQSHHDYTSHYLCLPVLHTQTHTRTHTHTRCIVTNTRRQCSNTFAEYCRKSRINSVFKYQLQYWIVFKEYLNTRNVTY